MNEERTRRHGAALALQPLRALLLATLLGACATGEARTAGEARNQLVGLSRTDLMMCAGFPTKTEQVGPQHELMTYERDTKDGGGVNLALPVIGGVSYTGQGGYCHATFEIVDGAVARLGYAGDNDQPGAPNATCAPLVRDCLRDFPGGAARQR
jgi:hypothetical protein